MTNPSRDALRRKRHARLRLRISGSAERPRLSVFRSAKYIYAQVIDDTHRAHAGRRLEPRGRPRRRRRKVDIARSVGRALAERAKAAGVSSVVLDRGGYQYHGRVRSLAEGAREGGLNL